MHRVASTAGVRCACDSGYTQASASSACDVTICQTRNCQNGGSCLPASGYDPELCNCRPGYTGADCESKSTAAAWRHFAHCDTGCCRCYSFDVVVATVITLPLLQLRHAPASCATSTASASCRTTRHSACAVIRAGHMTPKSEARQLATRPATALPRRSTACRATTVVAACKYTCTSRVVHAIKICVIYITRVALCMFVAKFNN